MSIGIRLGIAVALAACGWTAADGLRRAGAEPLSRVYVPWDVERLPVDASDGRVLALRPVSPLARTHDALDRADTAGADDFRRACLGVLRWGRNQPGTLLMVGRVATRRGYARGETAVREVGEALLLEYVARTPTQADEAARQWLEVAPPDADAYAVFSRALREHQPALAVVLAERAPDAAWKFLEPAILAGRVDGARQGGTILALARARHRPDDVATLDALLARAWLSPETEAGVRALRAELSGAR